MITKRFSFPLAISGTKEQLEALVPKLEALGYDRLGGMNRCREGHVLVTNAVLIDGRLDFFSVPSVEGRTEVSATNPDLVLALAAMVEGDEFHKGEAVVPITEYWDLSPCHNRFWVIQKIDGNKVFTGLNHPKDWISKSWFTGSGAEVQFRKATKEEIIKHFSNMNEKKLLGYKVKEGAPHAAAHLIVTGHPGVWGGVDGYHVGAGTGAEDALKKQGVLDLWFEPVYEPEKPKVEIITLRHSTGTFEIEVSEGKIYYRPENKYLEPGKIKDALYPSAILVGTYNFLPRVTHVDSGCKKRVPVEDWEKVLKAAGELEDDLPF